MRSGRAGHSGSNMEIFEVMDTLAKFYRLILLNKLFL
jgi:hypothetical protein